MQNFHTLCFLYRRQDAYPACYMQEFFRMLGLQCHFHVCGDDGQDDFIEVLTNAGFDIIVAINLEVKKDNRQFLPITFQDTQDPSISLWQILGELKKKLFPRRNTRLLYELYRIYTKNHMVSLLYGYTFTLVMTDWEVSQPLYDAVYGKYENVLEQLDKVPVGYGNQETGRRHNDFVEYFMYAKYLCKQKMNVLRNTRHRIEAYGLLQLLNDVNLIYQYDPHFSTIEFLNAKIVEADPLFASSARTFYDRCIKKCTVDVCKSRCYSELGKWLDRNGQPYEAGKAYLLAYRKAPDQAGNAFRLGVDYERKGKLEVAREYYRMVTTAWIECQKSGTEFRLPLMDLEYAYKAYRILDCLSESGEEQYKEQADAILSLVERMWKEDDSFVNRMYQPLGIQTEDICRLMCLRMEVGRKS